MDKRIDDTETLVRVRLDGGRYQAVLNSTAPTEIEAVHLNRVVAVARVATDPDRPGEGHVTLDLPAEVLCEGVQVISMRSTASGQVLDRITLMAGDVLDEDIRNEIALLRDELEMLKRAFRRHCVETGQD